jgi:hypothetical protein
VAETNYDEAYVRRDQLLELLGERAATALLKRYGGTRIWIPAPDTPRFEELAAALGGRAAACRLYEVFGGMRVALPALPVSLRNRIRELSHQGKSRADVARELGVTVRYVYLVLAQEGSEK